MHLLLLYSSSSPPFCTLQNSTKYPRRSEIPTPPHTPHAVLIYDARNPAFQQGGAGDETFHRVKPALKNPPLLQKCSWQVILESIKREANLEWLASAQEKKYGFHIEIGNFLEE